MKHALLNLVSLCAAIGINAAPVQNLEPVPDGGKSAKPENPALADVPDVPGLPRILLIGDSISMGYTLQVRAKLRDRANVHRPPENCGDTARGLARLDAWLGKGHWDVIYFNFGLHDLKYLNVKGAYVDPELGRQVAPPELYRERLRELTLRLKGTGARLVFVTTTPVPPGTLGRKAGDEMIYNQVALGVMKELKVPIDDLCGYVVTQQLKVPARQASEKPSAHELPKLRPGEIQLPFNVHFTPEGYRQLADRVAACIESLLPAAG